MYSDSTRQADHGYIGNFAKFGILTENIRFSSYNVDFLSLEVDRGILQAKFRYKVPSFDAAVIKTAKKLCLVAIT